MVPGEIKRQVLAALNERRPSLCSASFVGSAAAPGVDPVAQGSDIDLIVIWKSLEASLGFAAELRERLATLESAPAVADGWGLVTAAATGRPTLHLMQDPVGYFPLRSRLFRSSVAKYPQLLGKSLETFAPESELPIVDTLDDADGFRAALAEAYDDREPGLASWARTESGWCLETRRNEYCEPIDVYIASALHAARNWLRARDSYAEATSLDGLLVDAKAMPTLARSLLGRFVALKKSRRLERDRVLGRSQEAVREDFITLLQLLIESSQDRR